MFKLDEIQYLQNLVNKELSLIKGITYHETQALVYKALTSEEFNKQLKDMEQEILDRKNYLVVLKSKLDKLYQIEYGNIN